MFSYIIRLDDACPMMNHKKWNRVEEILERYGVKPIVGVIPDCMDTEEDFKNEIDPLFWDRVGKWQEKGWEISQHGLHHLFYDTPKGVKYFQMNVGKYTEFAGNSFEKQVEMIEIGYQILLSHGVQATSFFAPAHTYDVNTVKACKKVGKYKFISDGYALKPFVKEGMIFLPSIFDTPHRMPMGIYTFIFHPSKMKEGDFVFLEKFLECYHMQLTTVDEVLQKYSKVSEQGPVGKVIEVGIHMLRCLRKNEK